MRKTFDIKRLQKIAIVGVGLLGGSIGLALRARGYTGVRMGIGRRLSSLRKALAYDAVDEITRDPAAGVAGAQLVVLCTPIATFDDLLRGMAPALEPGTLLTDVASTKTEVVRIARHVVPRMIRFVGSHPMAGSEKTSVEFARADLFENALCLVTPTPRTQPETVRMARQFWHALGGRTATLTPQRHDALLARVSHLPHAVAAALVQLARHDGAIDYAGPGFADTTRIASGEAAMWTDIFRTNRKAMLQAIDHLQRELAGLRAHIDRDEADALRQWLTDSQRIRDLWITRRYRRKGVT